VGEIDAGAKEQAVTIEEPNRSDRNRQTTQTTASFAPQTAVASEQFNGRIACAQERQQRTFCPRRRSPRKSQPLDPAVETAAQPSSGDQKTLWSEMLARRPTS